MTWIKCARGGGSAPAPGHDPPTRPAREAGHGETEWQVASGRGRIYSSTRSSRAMGRVVAPAVIELDEGIRLMATITDSDLHALRIGDEIRVDFDRVRERAEMFSFTTKAADDARRYAAAALKASADVRGLAFGTPAPTRSWPRTPPRSTSTRSPAPRASPRASSGCTSSARRT